MFGPELYDLFVRVKQSFDPTGVLNPGSLRFEEEWRRLKARDLIGDLALIGKPLLGH